MSLFRAGGELGPVRHRRRAVSRPCRSSRDGRSRMASADLAPDAVYQRVRTLIWPEQMRCCLTFNDFASIWSSLKGDAALLAPGRAAGAAEISWRARLPVASRCGSHVYFRD